MIEKQVLIDYKQAYLKMVREGILSLEDEDQKIPNIPGIRYAWMAFIDAVSRPLCVQMYEVLKPEIGPDYETYLKLVRFFFINSEELFDRAYFNRTPSTWDSRLQMIEEQIDDFLSTIPTN